MLKNTSVLQDKISWEDFATVKNHKKQLQKHSKKKELSKSTWGRIAIFFPRFLKLHGKTPDGLIEEAMVDNESAEIRLDEYFLELKKEMGHNSARNIVYGSIQSFYSHNKIITKSWVIPEEHPAEVKNTDDNFPVWKYNEETEEFELNRDLFQEFFNLLSPVYRAVALALIGTGRDIGETLETTVGFVRNQDYKHKRLSLNGIRSKTGKVVDGFHSEESTIAARSLVAGERKNAQDSDPLYAISVSEQKRQFLRENKRRFTNNGVDVLPPATKLQPEVVEHAFREAQKKMGIKTKRGQHGPLRPKRLRKVYRTAADLAGLGDDKARQMLGQSTGRSSSGKYLETAREMQERSYMKIEQKIWIFKQPELSQKEKEATKELRRQLDKTVNDKNDSISKMQSQLDEMSQQQKIDREAHQRQMDDLEKNFAKKVESDKFDEKEE